MGLGEIMGPLLGNQQQARVNCIVTRFDFSDGVGRSRGLVFDSESLRVTGQGYIDLKSERLNLDFDTETRQSSLSSLAIPFQARGTLKSPKVIPDPAGAAAGVVGAVTGSGASLDSLGSMVAGLLGGNSGSETGSPRESPCIAALAAKPASAADSGTTSAGSTTSGQSSSDSSGGALDSLGEALDSLSRDLNSLFGGD